jgi:hypothetical protein
MKITADRLNDNTLEDSTTSGAVAASGFSVTAFSGRKVNGITTIDIICNRSGAAIAENPAGSGNIADTSMVTLPAGWRPPAFMQSFWDNGSNDGGATIGSSGLITLRTTSGSQGIANNSNPRVNATWISENG